MEDNFMDLLYVDSEPDLTLYDYPMDNASEMTDIGAYGSNWVNHEGIDTNGDGINDMLLAEIDMDGDGYAETFAIAHDYDQDGTPDYIKTYTDTNFDGDPDMVTQLHAEGTGAEQGYRYEMDVDMTGDHQSDYHDEGFLSMEEMGFGFEDPAYTYSGACLGSPDANGLFDPNTPAELVAGDPAQAMEVWECQGDTNRCALYSQKFVIEELTGRDIDIEEFADIAKQNGWFTEEGGTSFLNMNKMLEYYDVDHEMVFDSDMARLEEELRNGNKIIVSVDSGQIWHGEENDIFSPMTVSDHAIEVIGIDYSDPNNPMVVLNDSGTPGGCGEMVPADVFENAWSTGDHQMIVCSA